MEYSSVLSILLFFLTLSNTFADISLLQDQDQDHLDPLKDHDQEPGTNNQDKRTICAALNKCGKAPTSSYFQRLVIRRPSLVGYAPVVRPVGVRPVVLAGYRYTKPKLQFKLKAPSAVHGGWKPVPTVAKPVVELAKPINHLDVIHNKPVPHVDHVAPAHVHVDHVHLQPAQPTFVHLKPVTAPALHVDQIHQINVPHGNHYDTFTHVDHLHPAAVSVAQPLAPAPAIIKPFVPSPVLFEVTRPNLGVLPIGARFPTPILKEVPHVHLNPIVPVAPIARPVAHPIPITPPAVIPTPVQGIIHSPVGLPAVVPQPGVSVEYHGTRNYVPFSENVPFIHQYPVPNFSALHPHQHLPVEHAGHSFTPQQALPFEHTAHGFATPQALPHEHPTQFSGTEQQLPHLSNVHFQQQLQSIQQYQDIPQGQLPLEGDQQQNYDQYIQSNQEFASNGLNIQSFDQNNVIQPGQTDVQIPYHLPQHGSWEGYQQAGLQEESRGFGDQAFRPNQQLEAPYKK